jgi:hypothetical protein
MFNSTEEMELMLGVMSGESQITILERQEKRGQSNFVKSERLPIKSHSGLGYREKIQQMGIEIC